MNGFVRPVVEATEPGSGGSRLWLVSGCLCEDAAVIPAYPTWRDAMDHANKCPAAVANPKEAS